MYDTLDEVPWSTVAWVTGPSGNTVGIEDGFAVWLTGARKGERIPLDAGGPWRAAPDPSPEVLVAVEVLSGKGVNGAMFEKLIAMQQPKIKYTVHQDDGNGNCTACKTEWPAECEAEKNAVWVAEAGRHG